jgi:hypothetical protein
MFVALFFLTDCILYIIIPPPNVFRFAFIFSDYSKHLYSHLPNVSRHLIPYIISIFTSVSRSFCNNYIIKHLRNVPFELPPLHSRDFCASISPDAYLKMKSNNQKLVLCDDKLARYKLTIYAVWSLLPSSKDKINLARLLTIVESN